MNLLSSKNQSAYVLVVVTILCSASLLISYMALENVKTRQSFYSKSYDSKENTFLKHKQAHDKTLAWLNSNSKNLAWLFNNTNFASNFDIGSVSIGNNLSSVFPIGGKIKMAGTSDTPCISNNSVFGTASFPISYNIDTSAAFNSLSSFQNLNLDGLYAQICVISAYQSDSLYTPTFRIDVTDSTEANKGTKSTSYIIGYPVLTNLGIGVYSSNSPINFNTKYSSCSSSLWSYSAGLWSHFDNRANCQIATSASASIKGKIIGNVYSNTADSITFSKEGGEVLGTICESALCHSITMPVIDSWTAHCNGFSQGNLTISGNVTLASGLIPSLQCWDTVTISSNSTLTLNDKLNPFYFNTLNFSDDSTSKIEIPTSASLEVTTLNVTNIGSSYFYDSNILNENSPSNFKLQLLGTSNISIKGQSSLKLNLIAPQSSISLKDDLKFYGGIYANGINIDDRAEISYDESINTSLVPILSDAVFEKIQSPSIDYN